MGRGYMGNVGMHVDIACGPVWGESQFYYNDAGTKVRKSYTVAQPPKWLKDLMRSDIGQPNPY